MDAPADLSVLLVRAGQAVARLHRHAAADHGLTPTALAVLVELGRGDGTSHRELAARVGVAPATLTPVVDALEAAGQLRRRRGPADRRVVSLAITDAGLARCAVATAGVEALVQARAPRPAPEHEEIVRAHLLAVLAALGDG